MRDTTTTTQPRLLIDAGGKTYLLDLEELSGFLNRCQDRCQCKSIDDITVRLNLISDLVIDGMPDDFEARELKEPLKLLQELGYLFNGLLTEKQN